MLQFLGLSRPERLPRQWRNRRAPGAERSSGPGLDRPRSRWQHRSCWLRDAVHGVGNLSEVTGRVQEFRNLFGAEVIADTGVLLKSLFERTAGGESSH